MAYTGEQWRLGQNTTGRAADRLDFQLSTNATSLTTGTWADHDALDFGSPVVAGTVGALNGNVAPNRTALNVTITGLSIPDGASFWVRWADSDLIPGADDGLSVDDFSLTPSGPPPALPTLTVNGVTLGEGNTGTTTFGFTVALNKPAGAGGVTFDITTADGTAIANDDYIATSLTGQIIPAGSSLYTLHVPVNGDTTFEDDETFVVNVTNVAGASLVNAQAQGVIANDDSGCGLALTAIHAVQGSGAISPLANTTVSIQGVVTADYQGSGQFGGYFVQEEGDDADADPQTSEGIFVFSPTSVNAGDTVRVTGTVTEFGTAGLSLSELTAVSHVELCATGSSVTPVTVNLPVATPASFESFEGMLVTFAQPLVATDTFTLGRFGEVALAVDARLPIPTHAAAPGAAAQAVRDVNLRSRILLDDGNNQQNIDPTIHPVGGLSASNTLRTGDSVAALTGVLEQRFGAYRVQPIGPVPFTASNPRPAAPATVGGTLTVASFNVLNYFNGNGTGGGFPTARGANTPLEFARQRAKTVNAILGTGGDIVGLMELENDAPGNSAIEDLVAGLNATAGAGTYAYIDTGVIGTDEIRVALIFKPGVVTPLGTHAIMDSSVDPAFIDTLNRPSVAQTFVENGTGARLTVVVNHLKSKGSDCNVVGDPDAGDLQGECNGTRTKAAQALVRWLATDPTGALDADVILIGDMNSYRLEDPITAFRAGGYVDMQTAQSYSYVFDGESGYLDHALASPTLAPQVTGVAEWHINADEPTVLDYNVEFKTAGQVTSFYSTEPYRSSDHDPVVIGLALVPPFEFSGLQRPVNGAVSEVKAGSSVPLKFSLGGDKGLNIFAAGSPSSAPIACGTNPPVVAGDTIATAGGSDLTYDPDSGHYTLVWKTLKEWAGTCRRLTLRFTDGSWQRADFIFRH
ncbi:Endonuclease/Exonuclease/phosphatase family protein [Luteitalea pratensis]|uniref:Endonuclease/Exonuclease/phosphatase family protein n=1 Tax=Luteitalea pratensis TaxID=1855912 RepID=A0A143PJZ1_LUTPR|nr:ExeM/NucH family extracellular endonuclease [Luteitalea pratensis]AMY08736.1 Endonuclease/Exonuclease/phosphatase family protein [Luteitalea pratensis]